MTIRPRSLRIGIVGGSIAGCAAAIELSRAGHEVHVFERAQGEPRGAGIGLLPGFAHMVERDLISVELLPHIAIERHVFAARSADAGELGHFALELAFPTFVMHWSDLWRELRRRVPDGAYKTGHEVTAVLRPDERSAELQLADGSSATFDLVVFADGYRSLGREHVAAQQLEYRGYTLWRGIVSEAQLEDVAPLKQRIYRLSHPGMQGHTALYSIPGGIGSGDPSAQVVNFASYLPLPAAELPAFLTDRHGRVHGGSLPPGSMRPEEAARLEQLVRSQLPPYFAALIARAQDTFAQPIFSVAPLRHRLGRVVLIGDAGALVQPLTGSGVLKAIMGAISLANALRSDVDIDEALTRWDRNASATGAAFVRLGAHMEQALVWNMPDFATLSEADTLAFWRAATRPPSY